MSRLSNKIGNPTFQVAFHKWATILWFIASVPLALAFGSQILFVSWLSLYAIVAAHWSSWQAAKTEVLQAHSDDMQTANYDRLRKFDPDVH